MRFWFEQDEDGFVHAHVPEEDLPFLTTVLEDGLSSYPPTTAEVDGPCTYWLDYAEHRLTQPLAEGQRVDVIGGNESYLERQGDVVYADIDYLEADPTRGDRVPVADVLALVRAYREAVRASWLTRREPYRSSYGITPYPELPWRPEMSPPTRGSGHL